jgi:uncharacterized membrane protein
MVLELKVPHGTDFAALQSRLPVFLSYILSFLYVGIYWNNHHHLLHVCRGVTGGIMWANLHLLFWLSLLPFVTGWAGENPFTVLPSVLYGCVLLLSAVAYYILQRLILRAHGCESKIAAAFGGDIKGKGSPVLYAIGIGASFLMPRVAALIYVAVAVLWLVPDRRIEKALHMEKERKPAA